MTKEREIIKYRVFQGSEAIDMCKAVDDMLNEREANGIEIFFLAARTPF